MQDTGLGIPSEDQTAIFDEFRRSDRSVSLGYAGLGLGLAICKMLVEMQGGTIEVFSSGLKAKDQHFPLPYLSSTANTAGRKTAIRSANKRRSASAGVFKPAIDYSNTYSTRR